MLGSKYLPTNIQTQAVGTELEIMQYWEIQHQSHSKTLFQVMGAEMAWWIRELAANPEDLS